MKAIIASQYREKVNKAASKLGDINLPPEGWICTARKALGMSAAALARRLGKTRALVSNAEKAELDGGVTLKTMQAMAEAMNCRFVYAIIPHDSVETILEDRAKQRAKKIVEAGGHHMALEAQSLSRKQIDFEIERLASNMLKNQPSDFWNDKA
ncbi:MAG: mobile mystery protein A [Saprospiraceae bacterium]|nr:mobile mystery protein A [Saprospiraceae bacterium]